MEFVVALWRDEVLPAFDGEHDLNVDLCVGVGHAGKMPLLTELGNHFLGGFYKDDTPDGVEEQSVTCGDCASFQTSACSRPSEPISAMNEKRSGAFASAVGAKSL